MLRRARDGNLARRLPGDPVEVEAARAGRCPATCDYTVVMAVVSIRFSTEPVHRRLKDSARRRRVGVSTLAERLIDEGLRMEAHSAIVFREGPTGRRAVLAGGPEVADVIGSIVGGDVPVGQRRARAAELLGLTLSMVDAAMATTPITPRRSTRSWTSVAGPRTRPKRLGSVRGPCSRSEAAARRDARPGCGRGARGVRPRCGGGGGRTGAAGMLGPRSVGVCLRCRSGDRHGEHRRLLLVGGRLGERGADHCGLVFTSPRRFNRASRAYPGNLIAALGAFLESPPVEGRSWQWWLT